MERINLGYSLKNIPIPSQKSYLKSFISKVDSFIHRIRWKAFFFERNNEDSDTSDDKKDDSSTNFGFKSDKTPPQHPALAPFQNDLYSLIDSISFSNHRNTFQKKLSSDIKEIRNSKSVLVAADKTTNIYKMSPESYRKLLTDNITKEYKKTDSSKKHEIDVEAKKIAQSMNLADKIECLAEREAFITLKDHKDNFENNTKCRLLNPAKSEIGIISKSHLQDINASIRQQLNLNQWRSTSTVIDWFKNIGSKDSKHFLQLDIVDFYPSITEKLLTNALAFAKSMIQIEPSTTNIIMHSRKSLLFSDNTVWMKKGESLFDVTMGSHDGAEICELVGLYLLHQMRQKFPSIDFGLYRDDGLGCYKKKPGPTMERTRKGIIQLFKSNNLSITIDANMNQVNFLDTTLNLIDGKFRPYRKQNHKLLYINKIQIIQIQ